LQYAAIVLIINNETTTVLDSSHTKNSAMIINKIQCYVQCSAILKKYHRYDNNHGYV